MRISSASSGITRFAPAIALALAIAGHAGIAHAQAPAPPPGPPPLTQPSVPVLPGAPAPLVSVPLVVSTPLATPVPIPTALPTPVPRLFNCSCFTTASGTQWSGTVTAPDYAAARAAASGACFSYLMRTPQSPFIPPVQSPGLNAETEANAAAAATPGVGAMAGGPLTGASNSPAAALQNSPSLTGQTFCNVCACN